MNIQVALLMGAYIVAAFSLFLGIYVFHLVKYGGWTLNPRRSKQSIVQEGEIISGEEAKELSTMYKK